MERAEGQVLGKGEGWRREWNRCGCRGGLNSNEEVGKGTYGKYGCEGMRGGGVERRYVYIYRGVYMVLGAGDM